MKTEIDNNGRPTLEADLRDAQAEVRRLEQVNRELVAACKDALDLCKLYRLSGTETAQNIKAAIAKAKGKA